ALTFTAPGMPLIYSGQEAGLNKRLEFFNKDQISWENKKLFAFYTELAKLKHNNKALQGGIGINNLKIISTSTPENILSFYRQTATDTVVAVFNLTPARQKCSLDINRIKGNYKNVFNGESISLTDNMVLDLSPWKYQIWQKKTDL
ncbi:MAG TPA: alpha-glucosidase C-terminal domain-containing protein, partial [Spirochaetota bacterium]|nr:alpha-glucosidase C-terminal domain-containing protein [Spirochaetota bacterium]